MAELDPNTFQVVDTAAAEAARAEQLATVIDDAQRQMTVQQPHTPEPAPVSAPPAVIQESAPRWSPDEWRQQVSQFHGFGSPKEAKPVDPMAAINEKLEHLSSLIAEAKAPAVTGYRAANDPELANADPGMANRLENVSTVLEQKLKEQQEAFDRRIAQMEKAQEERNRAIEAQRVETYQRAWVTEIRQRVPDFESFLPGTPAGRELSQWAQQIPEYADAICGNPYRHSPHFVAQIIGQFKSLHATAPAKTPSLADIAAPVLGAQAPVNVQAPVPDGPMLNETQMATAWEDANQLYAQGYEKKGDALIAAYERTLKFKPKG